MFKSTSHFFRKVFEDKVTFTERDNYIESITCNYDLKKLKTLSFDLTIFISNKIEELEYGLDSDQIAYKIEKYKELGLVLPYKDVLNMEYYSAKLENLPLESIPKHNQHLDLMEMFYSRELFAIRSLKYKIEASYNKQLSKKKQELENTVKTDQHLDLDQTNKIQKNPHETIFKNDFAFILFEKMKEHYSDTKTPQADYSFLFDIMQKDCFIICTGVKFIDFLKDFDVAITKIDSSKTGNKRKTTLYKSTRDNLLEKHGLSTI